MLFVVTYRSKEGITEEEHKRSLRLFTEWTPPQGFEFKSHYVTGSGKNVAIVEISSAAALLEAMAPWDPFFEFDSEPCLLADEAVPIMQKTFDWRDSVK
jgi:hypothetical protein